FFVNLFISKGKEWICILHLCFRETHKKSHGSFVDEWKKLISEEFEKM
ncbi:unnamed protein product, partial [Brassica oleracea]